MKKALIIGYGISGQGAEKLLKKLGYDVTVVDQKRGNEDFDEPFDLAIVSPGIPPDHVTLKNMEKRGVEIVGEAELALRHIKKVCIGVTGTNGKTTLTEFLAHVLGGKALGNIGESLAAYAAEPDDAAILVIELSSFQLETLATVGLDVGVITNISPDHLDRYPSFEAYQKAKCRIGNLVKKEGVCFIPGGLDVELACETQAVSEDSYLQLTTKEGYWAKLDRMTLALSFAICERFGVSKREFEKALSTFQTLPHRLELVGTLGGVTFVNDSKGTNPAATLHAVREVGSALFLIVGGDPKGLSFETWKDGLGKHVRAIFTIGKAGVQLKELLSPYYETYHVQHLQDAVTHAYEKAQVGDTVLFSPGCASFDQFENYRHRGEMFKEMIQQLRRGL